MDFVLSVRNPTGATADVDVNVADLRQDAPDTANLIARIRQAIGEVIIADEDKKPGQLECRVTLSLEVESETTFIREVEEDAGITEGFLADMPTRAVLELFHALVSIGAQSSEGKQLLVNCGVKEYSFEDHWTGV